MEVNPVWDVQTTILTKEYNLAIACMLFWHSVLYQYDTPFAIAYCMYFGGDISEGHVTFKNVNSQFLHLKLGNELYIKTCSMGKTYQNITFYD